MDTLSNVLSGNTFVSINVAALCRVRLVLGRVTICGRVNHLSTSQPGRLSLLPFMGRYKEYLPAG